MERGGQHGGHLGCEGQPKTDMDEETWPAKAAGLLQQIPKGQRIVHSMHAISQHYTLCLADKDFISHCTRYFD